MKKTIFSSIVVLLVTVVSAPGVTRLVPDEYTTIQAAIDAAVDRDVVVLAPITYSGDGNRDIDFRGKAITVRSTEPNDPDTVAATIIECNGRFEEPHRGFYFHSGEDYNSVLSGLTITNGYAGYGGGIDCVSSHPTITNCTFRDNTGQYWYGGQYGTLTPHENSRSMVNDDGEVHINIPPPLPGWRGKGGGISCRLMSSPILTNCKFIGNSAYEYGGGMYKDYNSNPILTNCIFTSNTASYGGAMYNYSGSPSLTNCTFIENSAGMFGGGMQNIYSSPRLFNCIFNGNSAGWDGGCMSNYGCNPMLTNCTFNKNSARYNGGVIFNSGSDATLSNCILWGNTATKGNEIYLDYYSDFMGREIPSTINVDYSDVEGGAAGVYVDTDCTLNWGAGNIEVDPCFIEPGYWDANGVWIDGDYHLLLISPCTDAGDPDYGAGSNATDLDGNPRIIGGLIDMGAYEFQRPCVLHVDADATGANDGSNWENAYSDLQDALAVAGAGDEIRVAQGIYKPDEDFAHPNGTGSRTATFRLKNGVVISGGYAGTGAPDPNARDFELCETILSGDLAGDDDGFDNISENSYCVVTGSGTDETAVLDGFTITAGNASGSFTNTPASNGNEYKFEGDTSPPPPPPLYHTDGGGMYNKEGSPTVTNCTFSRNSAYTSGGGICNKSNSNPRITNCVFSGNSAWLGGGLYGGNGLITNCTFSANSASASGGGMYNGSGSLTVTNCTFTANLARYRGGGMLNGRASSPKLTSCTFSGNSATENGGGMYNYWCNLTLTNCMFSDNSSDGKGGGMYCRNKSYTWVSNCTFAGNSAPNGNAVACESYGQEDPSNIQATNCILWDGGNEIWNNDGSTIAITYSDVQGSWPGEGNIDADPLFVEPGYWDANGLWIEGDYHPLPGSLCINAGDPDYVAEPNETDLDGNPRVIGGRIDMGVYESQNTRPVADAGPDQVVECACNTGEGTRITLDGTGSYDSDGDLLTYTWTGPFVESPAQGATPTVTLEDGCPGGYVITLVVNDGTEDSEPNEVMITVVDTTPPEFALSVSPTTLWPPNHKMVKITPTWTVSDNCDAMPRVSLVSISINENKTKGNGPTEDDVQIGNDGSIYLRAERSGAGSDRIYTITYQAADDSGNVSESSTTVTVPHDRR